MTHETRTCSSRVESVRPDLLWRLGLGRWAPEGDQLADAAGQPQDDRDQQTPPTVQVVVEPGGVEERIVQAELAGPNRRDRDRAHRQDQVVLPALLDDEEAVGPVHG